MNINSRAYRKLHPRGKQHLRERMAEGQREARKRQHVASQQPAQPTAENQLSNHSRHLMRRDARRLLKEAKEKERLTDEANARAMEPANA